MSANNNNKKRSRPKLSGLRYVGMVFLCVIVTCCLLATAFSKRAYTVVYGTQKSTVTTYETDYKEIVQEAGIQLPDDATIESTESGGKTILTIKTPISVTVRCDGCTAVLTLDSPCTVADVLSQLKITCDGDDTVSCAPTDVVYDGMEINIVTRTVSYPTVSVPIAYSTVYRENASLDEGTKQVVTQGVNGAKTVRYKCVVVSNVVQEFGMESETVTTQPTDEIVEYGTKAVETEAETETVAAAAVETSSSSASSSSSSSSSQSTSSSSDTSSDTSSSNDTGSSGSSYSSVMTMTATAYTSSTTSGTTASGAPAQVGIIAADTSVLPMGTKVYITSADGSWTYGYAVVGDTGVSGNLIDLYFDTYDECIAFGRQTVLVYIVG